MLRFIDLSSHQAGLKISAIKSSIDACIIKATEGTSYINPYCDPWVQECITLGLPWGFYHYAGKNDPVNEADYLINNTLNYFNQGIPVLDWEGVYDSNGNLIFDQTVDWVNKFTNRIEEKTGVSPWIYGNPWRFNQGGVNQNCMRWVASYPAYSHPSFEVAESWDCPQADGLVGAWQFCSDGRLQGYNGDLDCSLFYGDTKAWYAYAQIESVSNVTVSTNTEPEISTLENDEYKITVQRK